MTFADRLVDAIQHNKTPLCVGLDPVIERIPKEILTAAVQRRGGGRDGAAAALQEYCRRLLGTLCGRVPAVKIQSACFELYGPPGTAAFEAVIKDARAMGYLVIGDLKRGDIGPSAQHYANAWLGGGKLPDGKVDSGPGLDAMTVNAYPGPDSLDPFLDVAKAQQAGLFVLVATSNPRANEFQEVGEDGSKLFELVAREIDARGKDVTGSCGYSSIGAVVGATKPQVAAKLRKMMPRAFFLTPGVGAQGATVDHLAPFFNEDGLGAIVPVSRSLIYAHESRPGVKFEDAVRDAAEELRKQLASVTGGKR